MKRALLTALSIAALLILGVIGACTLIEAQFPERQRPTGGLTR